MLVPYTHGTRTTPKNTLIMQSLVRGIYRQNPQGYVIPAFLKSEASTHLDVLLAHL